MAPPYPPITDEPPVVDVREFADPVREEVARKLGRYILAQLPYGKTSSFPEPIGTANTPELVHIPGGYAAGNRAKTVSGLYPGATADQPYIRDPFVGLPEMLISLTPAERAEMEQWSMNGVNHEITKALRIWYTYDIPDPDEPDGKRTVGAWLLVGYLGDGH